MSNDMEKIIAFLMKRSGKKSLPESEFYLTMSMDLQWCPPKQAKLFVANALEIGLLAKKDDQLSPTFDVKDVSIPTGFKPSKEMFQKKMVKPSTSKEDIVQQISDAIAEKTGDSVDEIKKTIETSASEKMVSRDVSALLLAKKYDISIDPFLPLVKDQLFTENKE
jgi:hypothetical protein